MVYNGKKSIDYVKQAFSISDADKEIAITLYKESVSILVGKDYIQQHPNAHTELSAIFGEKWITFNQRGGQFWHDPRLYVESNIAFNYANCLFSKTHQFVELARKLVDEDNRIDDKRLNLIGSQMNCILTCTSLEQAIDRLIFN